MRARITPAAIAGVAFFAAVIWFAVGFILVPMGRTVEVSLTGPDGFGAYLAYFAKPANVAAVTNTLTVGLLSVLVCGTVGTLLAIYLRFFCTRHRKLVNILLMSPVMIPGVIIVIAFIQLYGESGLVTKGLQALLALSEPPIRFTGLGGIVFVIGFTQYVYFFLNVYTALHYIDANVVDSVRSMGGGAIDVLRTAILPPLRSALIISSMTTFVSAAGAYSAPSLIGGRFQVLSTQISLAKSMNNMPLASAEVTILLVIGAVVTLLGMYLSRRRALAMSARARYWNPDVSHMGALGWVLRTVAIIQVILVVLPVAAIFYLSFMSTRSIMTQVFPVDATLANYQEVVGNRRTFAPLANSLQMALIAVGMALVVALPTAYASRDGRRAKAGLLPRMSSLLLMLPWCMPASVVAIDLINVFKSPTIFAFGRPLIGTFEILPIAYTIIALPVMLNTCRVAVEGVQENAEEASRSLGAGRLATFFRIALPAVAPGIIAGAILVFVRTMGEYTMSALLYGVHNRPISVSVVTTMQEYQVGTSMAYGSLVILVCGILLFAVLKLDSRRFGIHER